MSITMPEVSSWSEFTLPQTFIILISGKISSGKTTSAYHLAEELKNTLEFSRIINTSFANTLKEIAFKYFHWNGIKDLKGRKLLQDLGRVGRDFNKNIWVENLLDRLDDLIPPDFIIIDDWRFPNELDYLKGYMEGMYKIVTVRLIRPDSVNNSDISEISLTDDDEYDFVIYNDGSLIDLESKVKNLVDYIFSI